VRRVDLLAAGAACAAVVALAWANGGYFATAWGWAALLPLLVAGGALILRGPLELERLDAAWVGALAALAAWIGLSTLWSPSAAQPLLELERAVVYVATVLALVLAAGRRNGPALLGGTLAGIALVAGYALATRLLPDRFGTFDSSDGYQLSQPIGYWNGLGILVAMGLVLAFGAVAAARAARLRVASAVLLPPLACAFLFTFSRGAWLALAVAAAVLVGVHPARARLVALGLALVPVPALAVWLCTRSDPLTQAGASVDAAAHDGRRIGLALVALTVLQAGIALASSRLEPRVRLGRRERRFLGVAAAVAAAALLAAFFARVGTPLAAVDRAADAFTAPLPQTGGDLERRLFSASGNGRSDYWRVALGQAADHPVLGAGAGGYERRWMRERPTSFGARDAHSLYLETLAELGPIGLALLLAALAAPVVALVRARGEPLVPAAGAAYCAFLAHAGLDWDWELPAVTVPALLVGGGLVLSARGRGVGIAIGRAARAGSLVLVCLAIALVFVMHAGNTALAASTSALESGDADDAAREARSARRWLRWSFEPWQRLAEAQLAAGDLAAARRSYRAALERDPQNWSLWLALAATSQGEERRRSLERVLALNPRSPELDEFLREG
jgi:tetratricopeptide (TPR) repeat protein